MPWKIDEERLRATMPFMRDGQEIKPLFELKDGIPPVIAIPHMDFPQVVYMHPNEPFRKVEHRNANFEVVGTEMLPTEHLTKVVQDEAELKAALEAGWVKKPYLPKAPPDPNADLYGKRKATEEKC